MIGGIRYLNGVADEVPILEELHNEILFRCRRELKNLLAGIGWTIMN